MIVVVRKINAYSKQNWHKKIEFRNFKYFNANNFQTDLLTQEWELLDNLASVDKICGTYGKLFLCQYLTNMLQLERNE